MRLVTCLLGIMMLMASQASGGYAMQTAMELFHKAQNDPLMYRRAALYTEALARDDAPVEALRERGTIYYYQGKLPQADADLTAYLEKGGRDVRALLFRALIAIKGRQWERALADLHQADAWDPHRSDVLSHRAEVFYELGRVPEAERDVAQVLRLHDDPLAMARALRVRARIETDRGSALLAREAYRQAATLDPSMGFIRTWGDILSPEQTRKIGLVGLIVLPAVLIFRISVPKPKRPNSQR